MASLQGTNTFIGVALSQTSDTYGVAETVAHKLEVESIVWNENPTTLETNSIGGGGLMSSDTQRGALSPSLTINMLVGPRNGIELFLAQFLGTSGAPTEQNNPEGDYLHRITAHGTLNRTFLTIAAESSSSTVIEFPSVTVQDITLTFENPPNYYRATINCLFDELVDTSPTNNNAALQALSLADTELFIVEESDEFLINVQGSGALTTVTDRLAITSGTLTLARPQSFISEIKGSSGLGAPISAGRMTGSLSVSLKDHGSNAWETAAQAGTEYKASFKVEGTQIGTGDNKKLELFVPRMKHIVTPQYGLNDPGTNPTVLNFQIMEASANPTGMNDTTPYFEITNEHSSALIS